MNHKLSQALSVDKLPIEFAFAPDDDKALAEAVFARRISLQALEKEYESNRQSVKSGIAKYEEQIEKPSDKIGEKEKDLKAPIDKYKFVKIMAFVLGLIQTLSISFFTTAIEYWMYKFRDPNSNSTDANDRTYLQANFVSVNHLVSVGPSTVASILATFYAHKINAKSRIFFTLIVHAFIYSFHTIFVKIDTDDWQLTFFCITAAMMTIMSCSDSFGNTGNMIVMSQFPEKYMKFYLVGQGVSSLVNAILMLISKVCVPSVTAAALIYFITGTVLVSLSTVLFYWSTKLEYYKYYTKNMKAATKKRIPKLNEFRLILKYIYPLVILNIFHLLFPHMAITSLVVSEYYGTDSVWGNKYFITCITYLLNAVCGIIGRILFYKYEVIPSTFVIYLIYLVREFVIYPCLYFVNAKPRSHIPVLLPHDWEYAIVTAVEAVTLGYSGNILVLKQMRTVPPELLELSWMAMFLVMKMMSIANSAIGVLVVSLL